jgi:hypothetical protein
MNRIFDIIFPFHANCKANAIIKSRMLSKDESIIPFGVLQRVECPDNIKNEVLEDLYEQTFKTKDKLEDKAKSNVMGITISVSLIVGSTKLLSYVNSEAERLCIIILLIISVFYMIVSGWLVIHMLIDENETYVIKLNSLAEGGGSLRADYDQCILLNQYKNLIRNNYLFASYACIRNALISLFIMFLLIVISNN